jgi:hypothetical protein
VGLRPSASARAIASAAAAMWTPQSTWLTIFMAGPCPGSGPTSTTSPSGSSRVRDTASSPEAITSRLPSRARTTPPLTGASTTRAPGGTRPASCVTQAVPTVESTTTRAPGSRASSAPRPTRASSACWGVATMTTRTCAPRAAAAGSVAARSVPAAPLAGPSPPTPARRPPAVQGSCRSRVGVPSVRPSVRRRDRVGGRGQPVTPGRPSGGGSPPGGSPVAGFLVVGPGPLLSAGCRGSVLRLG